MKSRKTPTHVSQAQVRGQQASSSDQARGGQASFMTKSDRLVANPDLRSHATHFWDRNGPQTGPSAVQLQRAYGNHYLRQVARQFAELCDPLSVRPHAQNRNLPAALRLEREADIVADRVTQTFRGDCDRQTDTRQTGASASANSLSKCKIPANSTVAASPIEPVDRRHAMRSPPEGMTLPATVRAAMEQAFNADFKGVRIHTDRTAAALAEQLGAYAFTAGQDIFFSAGAYMPDTEAGQKLLAHELTHVTQQTGASGTSDAGTATGAPMIQCKGKNRFDVLLDDVAGPESDIQGLTTGIPGPPVLPPEFNSARAPAPGSDFGSDIAQQAARLQPPPAPPMPAAAPNAPARPAVQLAADLRDASDRHNANQARAYEQAHGTHHFDRHSPNIGDAQLQARTRGRVTGAAGNRQIPQSGISLAFVSNSCLETTQQIAAEYFLTQHGVHLNTANPAPQGGRTQFQVRIQYDEPAGAGYSLPRGNAVAVPVATPYVFSKVSYEHGSWNLVQHFPDARPQLPQNTAAVQKRGRGW